MTFKRKCKIIPKLSLINQPYFTTLCRGYLTFVRQCLRDTYNKPQRQQTCIRNMEQHKKISVSKRLRKIRVTIMDVNGANVLRQYPHNYYKEYM